MMKKRFAGRRICVCPRFFAKNERLTDYVSEFYDFFKKKYYYYVVPNKRRKMGDIR